MPDDRVGNAEGATRRQRLRDLCVGPVVQAVGRTVAPAQPAGVVAVVAVGMAHVASVNLTTVVGTHVTKGEEFGYFQFGGSDIIVLFQAGVTPEVSTDEGFRLVGSVIARCDRTV